jgi:lactam utilization protein B
MIDAAAEVYVITPSLPGRLDWLTDAVDRSRHLADERLDSVLGHVRALGAHASGRRGDDVTLTAFADAVAEFQPDHILIGLRSSEHANWQERGLIEHVSERFGLPVTSYAIDCGGHAFLPGV